MNDGMRQRLNEAGERFEEIEHLLASPDVISDRDRFQQLSREYGGLDALIQTWREFQQREASMREARELLDSDEAELRDLARDELAALEARMKALELSLQR